MGTDYSTPDIVDEDGILKRTKKIRKKRKKKKQSKVYKIINLLIKYLFFINS